MSFVRRKVSKFVAVDSRRSIFIAISFVTVIIVLFLDRGRKSFFHTKLEKNLDRADLRDLVGHKHTLRSRKANSIGRTSDFATRGAKKGKRRVALWIVREEGDKVAALFKRNNKHMFQVFEKDLNFMETAYKACEKMLVDMHLNIEKVEFLKAVKKGPSRYSNDLTTYVSLITEKNAKILHKALLSKNASAYSYKNFEDLSVDLGAADEMIKYKYNVKEDFPDIREFLHPVIVTAGKDPSKCLGEKPSWSTRRKRDRRGEPAWPKYRQQVSPSGRKI